MTSAALRFSVLIGWWSGVASLVPHLYVDAAYARDYMTRWRPRGRPGGIVPTQCVHSYARAQAKSVDARFAGLLVSPHDVAFVLHRIDDSHHVIAAILWNRTGPDLTHLRALRRWSAACGRAHVLGGGHSLPPVEALMWTLASEDSA